jgi:hypothetical protein
MRGHIARKGTRYSVVIDEARDSTGKRKQRWHPAGATRKEAEGKLTRILSRLQDGSYAPPTRQTLGTFLEDEWLPAVRTRLRPSTLSLYEMTVRAYLVPHPRQRPPPSLDARAAQSFLRGLARQGRANGQGTVGEDGEEHPTMIHRALRDAVR